MAPSVADPWKVAADHNAEHKRKEGVGQSQHECGHACPSAKAYRYQHDPESREREHALHERAVGISGDAPIRRLQQGLKLAEQDRAAEVEDDPLAVDGPDLVQLQIVCDWKEVESDAEQKHYRRASDGDKPPAALEDP